MPKTTESSLQVKCKIIDFKNCSLIKSQIFFYHKAKSSLCTCRILMPSQNTIETFFNNYDVLIICLTDISLQRCEDPVSKSYANVNIW